jgi:phosphate transport system substrate-binding protein
LKRELLAACLALALGLVWTATGDLGRAAYAAGGTTIRQIGSTTLLPLAEKWREEFNKKHPNVDIAVSGGGSGTGVKALLSGTAEIADASRPIKAKEIEQAKEAGINPVEHVVAYDGIAVIVNPANTLRQISVEALSDIYTGKTRDWSKLGARGLGEIQVVNRDSSSGTYEVFKDVVVTLGKTDKERDFAPHCLNQASNQAVLALVSRTKGAIGYVGLGYVTGDVRALRVIPAKGTKAVVASSNTVRDGSYPIARELYCYTNGQPTGTLKAYLDWIKGPEGQGIVGKVGYVPLGE